MGSLLLCATRAELSDEVQRELMVLFDSLHGTPGACRAKMEAIKERERNNKSKLWTIVRRLLVPFRVNY